VSLRDTFGDTPFPPYGPGCPLSDRTGSELTMSRRLPTVLRFDPETITARILAQELRDMIAKAGVTTTWAAASIQAKEDTVRAWCHGNNLSQPIRLFALIDALGYDVVFRQRSLPPRKVRLTR